MRAALIRRAACKACNVTEAEVIGRSRLPSIVMARHAGIYMTRRLTDLSLSQIGEAYGGIHHTTVLSACEKVGEQRHREPLATVLAQIEAEVSV